MSILFDYQARLTICSGVNMRALEELFQRAAARAEDWIDTISVRGIMRNNTTNIIYR